MEHRRDLPIQWRSLDPKTPDPRAPMPSQLGDVNKREFLSIMASLPPGLSTRQSSAMARSISTACSRDSVA